MSGRAACLMIALALGASSAHPALAQPQPPPGNRVWIKISWAGPPAPVAVEFHDSNSGRLEFQEHRPTYFRGWRPGAGAIADHRVELNFGGAGVVLTLRTRPGPDLNLQISGLSNAACTAQLAGRLESLSQAGSERDRLSAMIQAQQVLGSNPRCPIYARRRFAAVYFDTNCSLAGSVRYILLSDDAITQFQRTTNLPRPEVDQRILRCREGAKRRQAAA